MASAAGVAAAQTLPQVTVSATRSEAAPFDVPASVDVIDGERLRSAGRPEINLSESLAFVPGVTARDRQNYAQDLQLSIRGFGARSTFGVRGVRIYVDGIPATMPDGQGQLSHIDLASAGRVEILRGPFSVLYGNSSGGVLQVFTEPGEGTPMVTTSLAVGSDGLVRPGLRASGSNPGLGYVVSANHLSSDGWREHSAVSRGLANARLDFKRAEGSDWTVVANAMDLRADDPLGLTRAQFESAPRSADASALQFNTRKTVRQNQLGLIHEHRLAGGDRLRLMVYGGQRDTVQYQAIPVAPQANPLHPGGVIGLERQYGGADLRWTSNTVLAQGPLELVAGLSYDRMQERRQGWQNFAGGVLGVQGALRRDEDNVVSNLDPYLQAVWKFAPRWSLTAGVRHSAVKFSSADSYFAGRQWRRQRRSALQRNLAGRGPDVRLVAAVASVRRRAGRGFETPTFNELAYRPDGTAGLNFALKPSRSSNLELGVKGRSPSGSAWRQRVGRRIVPDRHPRRDRDPHQQRRPQLVPERGRDPSPRPGAGLERRAGAGLADPALAHLAGCALPRCLRRLQRHALHRARSPFRPATGSRARPSRCRPRKSPGSRRSGWRAGAELRRSSRVYVNDANSDAAASVHDRGCSRGLCVRPQGLGAVRHGPRSTTCWIAGTPVR